MIKGYALAGLRMYLGAIFALAVYPKFIAGPQFSSVLNGYLTNIALQKAQPLYQHFLQTLIIPHVSAVAALIVIGETAVAVGMITGTATRLSAVIAMILTTNYMLSKGLWWWNPSSNDGAFFTIALFLGLCAAGRVFGIDASLAKRWPTLLLW